MGDAFDASPPSRGGRPPTRPLPRPASAGGPAGEVAAMVKRPTLRTIAAESGFAVTTVSRALAGDLRIAEATRREVARIAARLGYLPDLAARRLRTGKTSVVALALSPHEEIFGFRGSMTAGLQAALAGTGYHVLLAPYDSDADPLAPIEHLVRNGLADGIIFAGTRPDDPRVAYLTDLGFPFASHGRTDAALPHAWCDYDNHGFARQAVERLAGRGRRRLLLVPPRADRTYGRHMREGFAAATRALGLAGRLREDLTLGTAAPRLQAALPPACAWMEIDGLICPGEVAAMAALAGLQDAGRRIGEDIDVIAKQTSPTFDLYRPRIDTIYEDVRQAGEALGRLLLRRMAGEGAAGLQVLLAPALIRRLPH